MIFEYAYIESSVSDLMNAFRKQRFQKNGGV